MHGRDGLRAPFNDTTCSKGNKMFEIWYTSASISRSTTKSGRLVRKRTIRSKLFGGRKRHGARQRPASAPDPAAALRCPDRAHPGKGLRRGDGAEHPRPGRRRTLDL